MMHDDYTLTALTLWREARGEGYNGMKAVGCVIRNLVKKRNTDFYTECTRKLAFSSITAPGEPQTALWPSVSDTVWQNARLLAADIIEGRADDITQGSTLYFNPTALTKSKMYTLPDKTVIQFPASWNASVVTFQVQIGQHYFFTEH